MASTQARDTKVHVLEMTDRILRILDLLRDSTGGLKETIEVKVEGVATGESLKMPILLLKEKEGKRVFPLSTGVYETQTVALGLQNVNVPRPLTHDLAKSLIERLGGRVTRVIIDNLVGRTCYARILVERKGDTAEVDSRPRDAIALALRCKVPILIDDGVFNKVTSSRESISGREVEDFRRKLNTLKPEDFAR